MATLPAGMVCDPTPPPLYGINTKVHNATGGRKTIDSRPVVINMDNFCDSICPHCHVTAHALLTPN